MIGHLPHSGEPVEPRLRIRAQEQGHDPLGAQVGKGRIDRAAAPRRVSGDGEDWSGVPVRG